MSHSVMLVIVKRPEGPIMADDLDDMVEDLLAPFSENLEVEEYKTPCSCVDRDARHASLKAASEEVGSVDEARDTFFARDDVRDMRKQMYEFRADADRASRKWTREESKTYSEMDEKINALWRSHFADKFSEAQTRHHAAHPMKDKPDAGCTSCDGTGERPTTYNPNSKWDWYTIGGRWDGMIADVKTCLNRDEAGDNVRLVTEIVAHENFDEVVPFAVLEPDGTYTEKGAMGWWGMVSNEKDGATWESECRECFKKYDDSYLCIVADLHI